MSFDPLRGTFLCVVTGQNPASSTAAAKALVELLEQDHKEVENLAYQLWQQRGSPIGSPAEDWFRAEAELRRNGCTEPLPIFAVSMGPAEG
jgi:hypothetical protein